MLPQQRGPLLAGLNRLPQLPQAQSQPKPPPCLQGHRHGPLQGRATGLEHRASLGPVAGERSPARPLPLELPAGRIGGPALQHA